MNKLTAHLILGCIDIACLFGVATVWLESVRVNEAIAARATPIDYQWPQGVFLLLLMVPILHASSVLPEKVAERRAVGRVMMGLLAGLIGFVFYLNGATAQSLERAGYEFDSPASRQSTFSKFVGYKLREL